jgi:hypothetical protein
VHTVCLEIVHDHDFVERELKASKGAQQALVALGVASCVHRTEVVNCLAGSLGAVQGQHTQRDENVGAGPLGRRHRTGKLAGLLA